MDQKTFDIIDKIAREHSGRNKTFGYLDSDDLKNEIFLICLDKIGDYSEERGELEHWLRVIVKNRLVNRFKDITKSVRSPCPRCDFYDPGESPSDCLKYGDNRYLCNKWRNYQLSIESRNSLLNAAEPQTERQSEENVLDKMVGSELKDMVWSKIDKSYHRDLQELVSGGKISKQRMKRLKKEVVRILSEESEKKPLTQLTVRGKNASTTQGRK